MDKLEKLYTGATIAFVILIIFIFIHYYNVSEKNDILDLNDDGIIDSNELAYHIKKEIDKQSKEAPSFKGIIKSFLTGIVRGIFMGLLLYGPEGALTSALVLGMINPIITSIEHLL